MTTINGRYARDDEYVDKNKWYEVNYHYATIVEIHYIGIPKSSNYMFYTQNKNVAIKELVDYWQTQVEYHTNSLEKAENKLKNLKEKYGLLQDRSI